MQVFCSRRINNLGASRIQVVRSGGAHSIFLVKNMKSVTEFCTGRLWYGASASCYWSGWNAVTVHIFHSEHTVRFPVHFVEREACR